ncbi:MAG: hypothetical protein ABJB78_10695, partial [Betaproteobacteria bacterium]
MSASLPVTLSSFPASILAPVQTDPAAPAMPAPPGAQSTQRPADAGAAIPDPSPINRELSLIAFNRRVLALAADAGVPLLERLRFLTIVGSNLDEFFEIRVAGLKELLRTKMPPAGMSLAALRTLLTDVSGAARALIDDQYRLLNEAIFPALAGHGVRLLGRADRSPAERAWVGDFFQREVRPLLTPIGLDPAHPFPQIVNKSLNFVVELSGHYAFGRETTIAVVKAPRLVP